MMNLVYPQNTRTTAIWFSFWVRRWQSRESRVRASYSDHATSCLYQKRPGWHIFKLLALYGTPTFVFKSKHRMGLPFWGVFYVKNPHQENQHEGGAQSPNPTEVLCAPPCVLAARGATVIQEGSTPRHHTLISATSEPSMWKFLTPAIGSAAQVPAHLWCQTPPSLTTRSSTCCIPAPMEIQVLSAFSSPIQIAHASFLSPYLIYSATTQFAFGYECWQGRHCCREVPK